MHSEIISKNYKALEEHHKNIYAKILPQDFEIEKTEPFGYKPNTPVCIIGMSKCNELRQIYNKSDEPIKELKWIKIPIYVIEPNLNIFLINLYHRDIAHMLNSERVKFFLGNNALQEYFDFIKQDQANIPECMFLLDKKYEEIKKECVEYMESMVEKNKEETKELEKSVNSYYDAVNWKSIYSDKRDRPLRVMIYTSRFSTYLQYSARDMADGFKDNECETLISIEKDDISRLNLRAYLRNMNEFKPDLMICIDYQRKDHCPKSIPFITWLQDDLPFIFNEDVASNLDNRNYILTIYKGLKTKFANLGCPEDKINIQIIPANTTIYKPINCNKDIDIVYIQHGGTPPEVEYQKLRARWDDMLSKAIIDKCYDKIRKAFFQGKYLYYDDYEKLLRNVENELSMEIRHQGIRDKIIYDLRFYIGNRFLRQIPLEMISKMDGIKMELYGNDWETHPRLSKHGKGVAQNGAELNEIYNKAKIALHLQHDATLNQRVTEGMASETFYIVQYLEKDLQPITDYFEENKDFVFFYNLEDLKKKIEYYLKNNDKRNEIARNAYFKILSKYNYKKVTKEWIDMITQKIGGEQDESKIISY